MLLDLEIRPLKMSDYQDWYRLWVANNAGNVSLVITQETWKRLHDPEGTFKSLAAFSNGKMVGFLHAVIHHVTGALQPVCYMQDLFVDPQMRRKGIARELVLALGEKGKAEHWHRIYWLTDAHNQAAQTLYKTLGVRLDFSLHAWPLDH